MPELITRRPIEALLAVGACLTLASCAGATVDLNGRTFTSTEVRGHELVEGSTITLAFEDDGISAQAGCNTQVGGATWDDDVLVVADPMASTMMACDDALMEQDQWLATFLTSSPALALDGATLTLGDDASGITLTEEK